MRTTVLILLCLTCGCRVPGCSDPAPTTRTFSHLHLPQTARDRAFDVAAVVMSDQYPVATSDRVSGIIRAQPIEVRDQDGPRRPGEVLGTGRRIRRVATAQVTGSDTEADIWCKVVVEQFAGDSVATLRNDLGYTDAPTATAADRDGATTTEQNEIWRTLHRDKQAERSVLRAIEATLGGHKPDAGAPPREPAS